MILLITLCSLCMVFLLALYIVYRVTFRHPIKKRPDPHCIPSGPLYDGHKEKMLTIVEDMAISPHEIWQLTSPDGLQLFARWYGTYSADTPVVLFFHGYHGQAEWDGYGMYRICKKLGYPILMPDMRAHGKSEGIISFGIRERHDVRLWVNEVLKRFGQDTELILAGVSMGATSVLLTAHDAPLPKNLLCVISDCAFSHPKGLLRPIYEKNHLPAGLLYRIMKLSARVFGGFRLDEAVAAQSITGLSVPVLFIHGSLDQIVPASMCHELYEAYPGMKRKLVLDGANHANSALVFPEKYEETVTDFLNETISRHTEKQG